MTGMDLDGNLIVNLNSEHPEALVAFYRDKIGLKPNPAMGEHAFIAANTPFVIDGHSEVKGSAKEPPRTLFNFSADDVRKEKARLESLGVKFLGEPTNEPISFATFVDPDGNYGQIFSMQGAPAGLEMFALMRTSEDPERMRAFYRGVVGLSDNFPDLGNPFMAGETSIYIGAHSEVRGQAKEPPRVLLNLPVADLAKEQKRIEGHRVKFIRTAGREPWGGIISTFPDPDGNYLQLMEYHG
jgi:predicted enzyme related to lactoylglutathione lyase